MVVTSCAAKTRWRQQTDAEKRVSQVVDKAAPEVVNDILEAGQKYLRRKQTTSIDAERAKLFEPPDLSSNEEETKS
jgi:hypothetical protein